MALKKLLSKLEENPNNKFTPAVAAVQNDFPSHVQYNNGGFEHGNNIYKLEAGDFIVFDPRVKHRAEDIMSDKKRIAIDWTLRNG